MLPIAFGGALGSMFRAIQKASAPPTFWIEAGIDPTMERGIVRPRLRAEGDVTTAMDGRTRKTKPYCAGEMAGEAAPKDDLIGFRDAGTNGNCRRADANNEPSGTSICR